MSEGKNVIVILGCGWLGQIVGSAIVQNGGKVYGSFRRKEVEEQLNTIGIQGFNLDFNESTLISSDILNQATQVLVFITPSSATSKTYPEILAELVKQFDKNVPVIFSSSTGVYPQNEGTYDEDFEIDPTLPNRLFPAEQALRKVKRDKLTILRLAGLVGARRHPAYSLSGRNLEDDGSNPINLIHAQDIVSAIDTIIKNAHFGRTYNLCSPEHPTKNEYYTAAANHLEIAPPNFGKKEATKRLISGDKIEEETSFVYSRTLYNFDDYLR